MRNTIYLIKICQILDIDDSDLTTYNYCANIERKQRGNLYV